MGYRIQYGSSTDITYFRDNTIPSKRILRVVTSICVCCVIVFAVIFYRDVIWRWILPGDPEVTQAALSTFGSNIRNGVPLGDAINVFCKEILAGAVY